MNSNGSNGENMIRRLMIMLKMLYLGQGLNPSELCSEFNLSLRTLQRDIARLKEYCAVDIQKGKDGKYYISRTEYEDGLLSFGDIKTFAKRSGVADLYPKLDTPMIADILSTTISKSLIVSSEPKQDSKELKDLFELLSDAILEHCVISFYYNDSQRTIKPYKLINTAGVWYLLGDEKAKLKHFTLSKIKSYKPLDQHFTPSNTFLKRIESNNLKWFSTSLKNAKILVLPKAREYFERKQVFKSYKLIKDDENGILLDVEFAFDDELLNIIKAWIPYIKIIEPQELDTKLKDILKSYINDEPISNLA
ncbi:transcriptional regulator [Campylobacter devanensis]|uniref:Transcriptional regulator (WYL domain) n=1 Tax=Campylobacter devanensis TaxID=3161138 RepID=A0A1X9SQN9_9BACT|nr:WYL domain-containing protein [Campylobacter lanienae]ARQ98510.1 transcriptional regulator (WYL domain) [Campylobacter lanienae]SUX01559.1 transcriptional regulator [Campylobacter lanienae]